MAMTWLFTNTQGITAQDRIVPASMLALMRMPTSIPEPSESRLQLTPTPDGTLFPIITFQPAFISAAQQDTGANTQAQLVIYHEFAHYLQWQSGAFPDETFMPERMAINRDVCTKKWYAERDAYHQECEFARENGLLDRLDPNSGLTAICRTSLEEFDDNLKRILPRGDASAAACVTYWRGL